MVDIEVERVRMYFLVENKAKMGTRRLGYAKYSIWGQNGVVLVFLGPKRRRFSHHNFFFLKFKTLIKRRRFGFVLTYPKRRRLDKCSKRRRFGPR